VLILKYKNIKKNHLNIFLNKKTIYITIPNTYFTKVAFSYCLEIEKIETLETEMYLIKERDTKINLFLRQF